MSHDGRPDAAAGRTADHRPDAGSIHELLRELAPSVLGSLVRRFGQFDACEDAMQDALLAAVQAWSSHGQPENPKGWLITVASRRMIDEVRSDQRPQAAGAGARGRARERLAEGDDAERDRDDSSRCCSCAVIRRCRAQSR